MKKVGVIAVLFSMLLGILAIGCGGSDPCEELSTKAKACCAKGPSIPQKATCNATFDEIVSADDHDSCETAVKDFKCNF